MNTSGHYIIGTAGHVDHGKTALIRALTGIETDRLREEQQRGISIELGFARLDLGNGQVAGVVDVPGHEKFIPQMLSGIAGIDLVLLLVDANEGVMPQTREHLEIMELLQVRNGILVISKADLVEEDWLDIIEEEIREQVAGTFLAKAPCCRVSALNGTGLDHLLQVIRERLARVSARDASGAVRLPVDRCFSISGFGTVVTGTLNSGTIHNGDALEVLPAGITARVRELQVHDQTVEKAFAGQRVAINLSGVAREEVPRGSVIGTAGLYRPAERLDAHLRLLATAPRSVKFRDPVHLHLGTGRAVARVVLLDRDELEAGQEAYVQLALDQPLLAHRGDRFIIRSYSPMVTIGGGVVIDSEPHKHKRFHPEVIKRLHDLSSGDLGFWLQKLEELQVARVKDLEKHTGTSREQLLAGLQQLSDAGEIVLLGDQWVTTGLVRSWKQQIPAIVQDYQVRNHLLHGLPRATLQARLSAKLAAKSFDVLLQDIIYNGVLVQHGDLLATPDWQPQPNAVEQADLERIVAVFKAEGFAVKSNREIFLQLGISVDNMESYLTFLALEEQIVRLNQENSLAYSVYAEAERRLVDLLAKQEAFTLAEFRDLINSGRKLAQALLEYFDARKYTRRSGDQRVAWQLPETV